MAVWGDGCGVRWGWAGNQLHDAQFGDCMREEFCQEQEQRPSARNTNRSVWVERDVAQPSGQSTADRT